MDLLEQEGFVYKESGLGTKVLSNLTLLGQHNYMPVSQVPTLSKRILEGSIYSYLHKKLHIKFGGVFRRIKADLPDKYDRQYLGANESTPILEIVQIVWTNSGVNLEYSRSRNLYSNRSYIMVETSN
ncbi:UTRA domain-containing protein [Lactobacillus delbrueckii subsp. delbrueckii]|uniref:UTRA domain-containing protein n=1 Tax=Lactobacillus delbrueckii subsp. delbrueckii TaxID=83684 RepID=A0AAU9R1V6_9LACO|nr:UTRA domain-containing protein [Lactobacillus delbrueckii]CAH1706369.1 UTRA domain-containing protein [Lactobacillus delbrueckii subsp. delbrueckii]